MLQRIHILGASGSGTTTLGRAFAERLQCPHVDTDDYFWVPTNPPFTQQRARTERQQLLLDDLTAQDAWVVSPTFKGGWSTVVNFALWPPPDTKPGPYPQHHKRSDDSLGRHALGGGAYRPPRSARASLAYRGQTLRRP